MLHASCFTDITVGFRCSDLQALDDEEVFLNIDLMHMYDYDRDLYSQLVAYPGEVIPLLDAEARYIAEDLTGEELTDDRLLTVSLCSPLLAPFGLHNHPHNPTHTAPPTHLHPYKSAHTTPKNLQTCMEAADCTCMCLIAGFQSLPGICNDMHEQGHGQFCKATLQVASKTHLLLQVRPFNLKEQKVIRDLNPEDMNKLISVSGMVTRSSNIIPDPR